MASGNIKRFCQSVLPQDFQQVSSATRECQSVIDQHLPERLQAMVQVTAVSKGTVTISATTPVVANYLRLHQDRLQQVLRPVTGQTPLIQIKTRPASVTEVRLAERPASPAQVNPATINKLASAAHAIEDEALRTAMESLAETLASRRSTKD